MDRLKMARPRASLKQGRTDWYRINNLANSSEVYIYDEIGYIGVSAKDFVKELQDIKQDVIELHLNSPGGEVFDGLAIYNALKSHRATVNVYVDGLAASIASVIAMAGDRVIMTRNAQMMIHDGHALTIGNASDMKAMADLLDKTSDNIASVYEERAGGTKAQWRKAMQNETWYNAQEAVTAGLADEIAGDSKQDNSWDLSIFNYSGRDTAPVPEIVEVPTFTFDPAVFRKAFEEAAK